MFWPIGHVTLWVPRTDNTNRASFRFAGGINSVKIFASTVSEKGIQTNNVYSILRFMAVVGPTCGHYKN